MKKYIVSIVACCLAFGIWCVSATFSVRAASLDYSYTLTADDEGCVVLPAVKDGGDAAYVADIYRGIGKENKLLSDVPVGKVKFPFAGEFTLVYKPIDGAEEDELIAYASVVDTAKPVLTVSGLNDTYYVGDTTQFSVAYSDNMDTGERLIYTLRVLYERIPNAAAIQEDGQVYFEEKGEYTLIFTARDFSGNETTATYTFSVQTDGFDFNNLIPVLAVCIMLAMFVGPIAFVVHSEFRGKKEKIK